MYDLIQLGNKVTSVDVSPEFDAYSKVIIHIDDDTQVVAGNDSGRTLEINTPFGNQAMADRMLASLQGFQYSPYKVDGALLDPAAEIGDAVQTSTSFGGIYTRSRNFGRLMKANISAPTDEEIDYEYKFETPQEREFKRQVGEVKASIILTNNMIQAEVEARENADTVLASRITQTSNAITAEVSRATQAEGNLSATLQLQANEISAKVASSGGNSSFGWTMNSTSHVWKTNNTEVMRISASGLMVKGEVQATSGKIGGFTIGASAIYNNISQFGGTQNSGVYLGTNGIQLGQNFKVDSSGNVTASNMTLKGTLTFLNSDGTTAGTMSAANLKTGAEQAYNNYGSWNSAYSSTSPGGYCYGGAGGGYSFTNATVNGTSTYPKYFTATNITAKNRCDAAYMSVSNTFNAAGTFNVGGITASWKEVTINGTTIRYLGR